MPSMIFEKPLLKDTKTRSLVPNCTAKHSKNYYAEPFWLKRARISFIIALVMLSSIPTYLLFRNRVPTKDKLSIPMKLDKPLQDWSISTPPDRQLIPPMDSLNQIENKQCQRIK